MAVNKVSVSALCGDLLCRHYHPIRWCYLMTSDTADLDTVLDLILDACLSLSVCVCVHESSICDGQVYLRRPFKAGLKRVERRIPTRLERWK